MLFMPPGGTVLELRNNRDNWNNCYFSMASALSQRFYYLLDKDPSETDKINLSLDINELRRCLTMIDDNTS